MATIYDIAERADVSTATVSRVLNGMPGVKEATRNSVLEAAKALNYQPHASARNLARQHTNSIAVIAPVVANHFYMDVMRGVQTVVSDQEYDLLIHVPPRPEDIETRLDRALQPGRSDGLLLLSTPMNEEWAQRLLKADHPTVLVDAYHPDVPSIAIDNERGGYEATKHLIDVGYQRIGHITAFPEPPPAVERRKGYERALEEAGHSLDQEYVEAADELPFAFAEKGGYRSMRRLLQKNPPPDAVFAASDMQALGALRAAREEGVAVPGDVALIGFDDIELSRCVGLSTLRQPTQVIGKRAVEALLRHIEDGQQPVAATVLAPQLVVRETCGAEPEPETESENV